VDVPYLGGIEAMHWFRRRVLLAACLDLARPGVSVLPVYRTPRRFTTVPFSSPLGRLRAKYARRRPQGYNSGMTKKPSAPAPYVQPYRYPSPNIPMTAIRRFARQIAERFRPEKIILFGSYAYGTPHAESDVDLLVIMPARDVVAQAIRIDLAFERPFSLDLIVRTPNQIERGLKEDDWFLREVIEKGKVLYEAPDSQVGSQGRGRSGRGAQARGAGASPRPGVLPLPAGGGEVPQGPAARIRRRRAKDTRS
jgi:predicted nucleotidyltransferase